jgi:kynurenine formamidase
MTIWTPPVARSPAESAEGDGGPTMDINAKIDVPWPGHTGNWHRWPNDRGTLNLITPAKVLEAVAEVQEGLAFGLSRVLDTYDPTRKDPVVIHKMANAGAFEDDEDRRQGTKTHEFSHQSSADSIWLRIHGMTNTHADSLAHVGAYGVGFNGIPFGEMVTMGDGAKRGAITDTLTVVTRGVLADIPRLRGVKHLEPGDSVDVSELRAASPDLRPGDALLIRTGSTLTGGIPPVPGDPNYVGIWSGLHANCMDYIRERDVAVLATDGPGDTFPSTIPECDSPIHVLALVFLGLHLIHNMDLESFSEECFERGRNSFMFSVSSINIPHGTGSPITPIAIL